MATLGTGYANFVLENKMTDLVNTRLEAKSLMTMDFSLVEKLAKGAKNSAKGAVSFIPKEYEVERFQQTFVYNDLDIMQDPYLLEVAMQGAAEVMANDIKSIKLSEAA